MNAGASRAAAAGLLASIAGKSLHAAFKVRLRINQVTNIQLPGDVEEDFWRSKRGYNQAAVFTGCNKGAACLTDQQKLNAPI